MEKKFTAGRCRRFVPSLVALAFVAGAAAPESGASVMEDQGFEEQVVFTSGGTIATIVAHVLGAGPAGTYQFYEPVINCSVTQLLYNANKVSLSYYNDHSFLDLLGRQAGENLITYR